MLFGRKSVIWRDGLLRKCKEKKNNNYKNKKNEKGNFCTPKKIVKCEASQIFHKENDKK